MKASDIDDMDVLRFLAFQPASKWGAPFATEVYAEFGLYPIKVIAAKLDKMRRRGLIDNGTVVTLSPRGRAMLAS